jgi:hypothetical protein
LCHAAGRLAEAQRNRIDLLPPSDRYRQHAQLIRGASLLDPLFVDKQPSQRSLIISLQRQTAHFNLRDSCNNEPPVPEIVLTGRHRFEYLACHPIELETPAGHFNTESFVSREPRRPHTTRTNPQRSAKYIRCRPAAQLVVKDLVRESAQASVAAGFPTTCAALEPREGCQEDVRQAFSDLLHVTRATGDLIEKN